MRAFLVGILAGLPAISWAADAASEAATNAPGEALGASPVASFLPLILIFLVFYFLIIKPQQKRLKEHQAMLGALKKGDEVVTAGGIVGRITRMDAGDQMTVEIAKNVEVSVLKSTVSGLTTPAKPSRDEKGGSNRNDNSLPGRDRIANDN